jgi:hypothetical protein
MSALRTDRPRNAALNKERARVQYAQYRLNELRVQGVDDAAAWDTIRAELKRGVVLLTRTELVDVIDPLLAGMSRAWTPEGSVTAIKVADAVLATVAKATGSAE